MKDVHRETAVGIPELISGEISGVIFIIISGRIFHAVLRKHLGDPLEKFVGLKILVESL